MEERTPWHRSGAVMAVAMAVMNVATYGYTMVSARLLGPGSYSAFAAVMGLLLVIGVLQLGLQTTGARRVASHPESVAEVERQLLRVALVVSAALAVACLALSPAIDALLNLDRLSTALLVGLTAFPMTLMGAQAGILQGERRWLALAVLYVAAGVPRLVLGTLVLLWRPSEETAVAAVAVAFFAPVLVGWWALRRSAPGRVEVATAQDHGVRSILGEIGRNSHALLAFLALSNADVIVARDVLDAHEAGLYAGGLILVKAVLFLPQFVVVVAFPSMSDAAERHRALVRSVVLVLVLGAVSVLAARVLADLALVFVGGPQYAEIRGQLWLFAILGTVLSLLQLVVYSVVARQARFSVYAIWAALVVFVVLSRGVEDDVTALLLLVLAIDAVLLVLLLAVSLRRTAAPAPEPEHAPAPAGGPGDGSVGGVVPGAAGADGHVEGHGQLGR